MVPKGFERKLGELESKGRIKTIKTAALLKFWLDYSEESWRPEEICFHSNSKEKPQTGAKNSQEVKEE